MSSGSVLLSNGNFGVVVAASKNKFGIGCKGTLPWRLKEDSVYFKRVTSTTVDPSKRNCCIMGRKTYFSIPERFRPLPNRLNIILTRNTDLVKQEKIPEDVIVAPSLDNALHLIREDPKLADTIESVFVIGGDQIYHEAIKHPGCKKIYFTLIHNDFDCDTFFPADIADPTKFQLEGSEAEYPMHEENGINFQFLVYNKVTA